MIAFALAVSTGAASGRDKPLRNAARDAADRVASVLGVGECAKGVLARHGLLAAAMVDPGGAALRLEGASACGPEREPDLALTLAELWYRDALRRPRHDPASAVPPLRAAAAAAALALADPSAGCCDRAILVHNDAVARLIQISHDACASAGQHPSPGLASLGVTAAATDPFVDPGRFADVVLADDVRVTRIRHRFRTDGLGVPVVGTRCVDRRAPAETDERFFPAQLRIAATVVASPGGGLEGAAYRRLPLGLVFHDPFQVSSARVGGRTLTLATDRTAQLAMQASQDRLRTEAIRGVLTTEFDARIEPGLYMLRPYAPGKIPVVFIHGLASTPVAFLQEINDFSNDPALAARYQFWVFAYPTGAMVARSAQRLREALDAAEAAYGTDPAFRRMVVAGHSMGGILAHMIVSDSGRRVWDGALSVPPERLRASPATRAKLDQLLFFRPRPYVSRVVFIATPHRGSRLANGVLGRYYGGRIRPAAEYTAIVGEIEARNGPGVIRDENFAGASINAIGNLRVDSPLLDAIAGLPVAPGVPYHTIAFRFAGHAPGDLVVPLASAHLDGAASEAIAPGTHGSEQGRAAVGELRRILLEHLAGP